MLKYIVRSIHRNVSLWETQKSALASLRKRTGYTFVNCKKALEMHDNDLAKAEEWLKKQAESLGWMKATKLQGRKTTQGLIGVAVRDNLAAMVEVNCETDFVARNENFQRVVETSVQTCIQLAEATPMVGNFGLKYVRSDELKTLKCQNGKPLSDHLALMIGVVGENAALKRAVCFKSDSNISLAAYAHPGTIVRNDVVFGRLGGIVALKHGPTSDDLKDLGQKVCQHIVGMDPKKIGTTEDEPDKNVEDEKCLIHQSYLHDESFTVGEVLQEYNVEIVDFKRFECGGSECVEQVPEMLETCQ